MNTSNQILTVDMAGEIHRVDTDQIFTIGRTGDLVIDDNPYLHREFITISYSEGMWWVQNTGSRLPLQLTDSQGLLKAVLAPGARSPLVFEITLLVFSAGGTTYEIELETALPTYHWIETSSGKPVGETTMGAIDFTESQLLAILALAEPILRNPGSGNDLIPTSVAAAKRLGWTLTRFNRKLDNVCEKLERAGVDGLRGNFGSGASNRRIRLVDYAISTLLVTAQDLAKLQNESMRNAKSARHSGAGR